MHLHPGYFETGLKFRGPGLSPDGIRARAGYHQRTLEALITRAREVVQVAFGLEDNAESGVLSRAGG